MRRVRGRTWVIAAAVVVVVAGGSIYWFGFGIHAGAQSAQAATRSVTASLQTLQKTVSGSGALTPAVQDDVDFAASGTVTAVDVVAGTTVAAGQTIATLDTLTENANLTSAKAALASANAQLSSAQSASDGSSAAVAKITADQAAVAVAQASVDAAQTAYNGTTLTSPIAGLVTAVNLAVGDVVTGGSSGGSSGSSGGSASAGSGSAGSGSSGFGSTGSGGSTGSSASTSAAQFTVVGTGAWQVTVSVGATDLKNIAVNQQVQLSSTENPAFFGTVASIGLLPTATTGAATYPVVVAVTGTPANLYDGVTVTAAIVYQRRTDVLTVPSAAITTADGISTVNKVVNGTTVKTTVTVGEVSGNLTEITKGLSEGDTVAVATFNPAGAGGATGGTQRFGGAGGFRGGAGGGFGGAGGGFGGGAGGGFGGDAGGGFGGNRGGTNG
ncbi:efflux RND transporter periplasmic adaptor subunit [Leifsonia sp. NPDC058230]|uniref:efflux RND transporter periplasmic adaptor subunit n=1 Tax=Leifsonia sp. NPDC058230 TaxID=3346391 RepID=UPI0036DE334A